jgi:DNA repair protein RadC
MQEPLDLIEGDEEENFPHPGGKLRDMGADTLTDAELLAIIIGAGNKDRPAMDIARDVIGRFGSFIGMAGKSFDDFLEIKGMGEVKVHRIAATLEIAKRICREVADIE